VARFRLELRRQGNGRWAMGDGRMNLAGSGDRKMMGGIRDKRKEDKTGQN
jgi:hypothetical protein